LSSAFREMAPKAKAKTAAPKVPTSTGEPKKRKLETEASSPSKRHAASEGSSKQPKPLVCLLCKATASTEKWAQYHSPSPGVSNPFGDQCLSCNSLHHSKFGYILSWELFVEFAQTPDGATAIEQARSSIKGGARDFCAESVSAETITGIRCDRKMVVLNLAEYKTVFGKAPPQRSRIPYVMMPKENDPCEMEKGWCFKDPRNPHRTISMRTSLCDRRSVKLLRADDSAHTQHGQNIFEFGLASRQENMIDTKRLQQSLLSIEEHSAALGSGPVEGLGHEGLASSAARGPTSASGGVVEPADAAFSNPLMSLLASPTQVSCNREPLSTPRPAFARTNSGIDCEPGDSVSQIGGCASILGEEDPRLCRTSKELLAVLKSKVPLAGWLAGEKLGRQERALQVYFKNGKLDECDMKLLRLHVKQVP
jgi:hypothetical protein